MSNQTLLIIAIALLGAIFLMLTKCAFLLDRAAKAARRGTETIHINHPTSLGLRGGGGGGGVGRTPATSNAKVKITPGPHLIPGVGIKDNPRDAVAHARVMLDEAQAAHGASKARVADAQAAYTEAARRYCDTGGVESALAEETAKRDDMSVAEARENYAADKKLRDDEHATLKSFDPRLRLGDLTPAERADMSRKVAKIRVNTVLDSRSTIATAIRTMPFEPEHIEALVKLHNALGVAVREFDASIKAAPSNADTFGLQS